MKLHEDKKTFAQFIMHIHETSGYRMDVLEKDYYVVLMLKELAEKQRAGLPAYFKGGTALYKMLRSAQRFSEDIDLSVDSTECSRTQNDKRLANAAKRYTALERNAEETITHRSEVISQFTYDPVVKYAENDALQRFGNVKVEATSFTISEPIEPLTVSALLYELANEDERKSLRELYDMEPFVVQAITAERLFVDKIFAAEAYVRDSKNPKRAFEAAKHIYDLAVMAQLPRIQHLLSDESTMKMLLDVRMREEKNRLDGIPNVKPSEFILFRQAKVDLPTQEAYEKMLSQYVFQEKDRFDYRAAMDALESIGTRLMERSVWKNYSVKKGIRDKITGFQAQVEKERTKPIEKIPERDR